jgi:ribonuclease P protein component
MKGRIKSTVQIQRIFKKGERVENLFFKLFLLKERTLKGGFSVIVGRRYGSAVERNRIKRVYREILRKELRESGEFVHLLLLPKGLSKRTSYDRLKSRVGEVLQAFK